MEISRFNELTPAPFSPLSRSLPLPLLTVMLKLSFRDDAFPDVSSDFSIASREEASCLRSDRSQGSHRSPVFRRSTSDRNRANLKVHGFPSWSIKRRHFYGEVDGEKGENGQENGSPVRTPVTYPKARRPVSSLRNPWRYCMNVRSVCRRIQSNRAEHSESEIRISTDFRRSDRWVDMRNAISKHTLSAVVLLPCAYPS